MTTREPGGTPLGETLRGLLLHEPMCHDTETLLTLDDDLAPETAPELELVMARR